MKLILKEFQEIYVDRLVQNIQAAAKDVSDQGETIAFSSPTGSGKTVMATATIERLLAGDASTLPDEEATFLWLSDQPEINEQTRRKMVEASSILDSSQLVIVDASFDEEMFAPGKVYFLNTQKLGKDKQLVTHGDERTYTIWDTVNNTARLRPRHFFVFIDEAHRGMVASKREQNEAATIVQKFIIGSPGELDKVPIVVGISATPKRFLDLVQSASRTVRPVNVPVEDVRVSGLLVDSIRLFYPSEKEPTDLTMLRAAARSWKDFATRWKAYCGSQRERIVKPILVVQVRDGTAGALSDTNLEEVVNVVNETIGHLPPEAFAHSFQEGTEIDVGAQKIRYLSPADITSDPDVVVVFFKMSLNTGWDCPRAEVMMSFRRAADSTLIAQLVGRMIRSPLARRVPSDEFLNTVCLFLPHYDEIELKKVVDGLKSQDGELLPVELDEMGKDTIILTKRRGTEKEFAALSKIPSYVIPRIRKSKGVRRLMKLARLLANDSINPDAVEVSSNTLLALLKSEYRTLSQTSGFQLIVESKGKVQVKSVDWQVLGESKAGETTTLDISKENLDDLFNAAGRKMGEGLHKAWWKQRTNEDGALRAKAKLEAVAFCIMPSVLEKLERESHSLTRKWLKDYRDKIDSLMDDRRQHYDEVLGMAAEPEVANITYLPQIEGKRFAQTFENHLYVDENGLFSFAANNWEATVIHDEFKDATGWFRNPDRKSYSLTVPYKIGDADRGFYPDFLVTRLVKGEVVVDLVDPHHTNLADALPKAVGLATYADKHSQHFGHIELVRVVRNRILRLDLANKEIREKVSKAKSNKELDDLYENEGQP